MAEEDIIQRIIIDGDKQILQAFSKIGSAGDDTFSRLEQIVNKVGGNIKNITGKISSGLEEIADKFGVAGKTASKGAALVESAISKMGTGATVFAASATILTGAIVGIRFAFQALAESAANAADNIGDAAAQTGQSAKDYQRIGFAFKQTAKDGANVEMVFQTINDLVAQAQNGGSELTKKFDDLRVKLIENNGAARSASDILLDLSEALEKIDEPGDRAAKVIELFGRRIGGPLVALLGEGRKGLEGFMNELDDLGGRLTDAEIKIGDEFDKSTKRFNAAIDGTRNKLGLLFAPTFTRGNNAFAQLIARNQESILSFGKVVARVFDDIMLAISGDTAKIQSTFIKGVATGVTAVANAIKSVVVPVFEGWLIIVEKTFKAINDLFGTNFSTSDLAIVAGALLAVKALQTLLGIIQSVASALNFFQFAASAASFAMNPWPLIIAGIVIALGLLILALRNVDWAAVAQKAQEFWQAVQEKAGAVVQYVKDTWGSITQFFTDLWNAVASTVNGAWIAISNSANTSIEFISGLWEGFKNITGAAWDWVKNKINSVWESIKDKVAAVKEFFAGPAGGEGGGGAQGRASGGPIWGRGTSTSDSIPIWASHGEYMIKAAAVKKYGLGLMDAINSMRFDMSGFALGGPVVNTRPRARYATGGPIAGGGTLNLTIDGRTFSGLRAPSDTMEDLRAFATGKQLTSAGRKPAWYKG